MEYNPEPPPSERVTPMPGWRSPKILVPLGIVVLLLIGIGAAAAVMHQHTGRLDTQQAGSVAPSRVPLVAPDGTTVAQVVVTAVPTSTYAALFAHPSEPAYVPGKGFSPDAQRVVDVVTLQGALEKYRVANERYPSTLDALFPTFAPLANGTKLTAAPTDPETHQPYTYHVSSDGATYQLSATLSSGKQYTGITVDTP